MFKRIVDSFMDSIASRVIVLASEDMYRPGVIEQRVKRAIKATVEEVAKPFRDAISDAFAGLDYSHENGIIDTRTIHKMLQAKINERAEGLLKSAERVGLTVLSGLDVDDHIAAAMRYEVSEHICKFHIEGLDHDESEDD